jgi:hypothetical protein
MKICALLVPRDVQVEPILRPPRRSVLTVPPTLLALADEVIE